jgi:hypothetical protein
MWLSVVLGLHKVRGSSSHRARNARKSLHHRLVDSD